MITFHVCLECVKRYELIWQYLGNVAKVLHVHRLCKRQITKLQSNLMTVTMFDLSGTFFKYRNMILFKKLKTGKVQKLYFYQCLKLICEFVN